MIDSTGHRNRDITIAIVEIKPQLAGLARATQLSVRTGKVIKTNSRVVGD